MRRSRRVQPKKVSFEHLESVIFRQNDLRNAYESANGYSKSGSDGNVSFHWRRLELLQRGRFRLLGGWIFQVVTTLATLPPNSHKIYASSNNQNMEVGAGPTCNAESYGLFIACAQQELPSRDLAEILRIEANEATERDEWKLDREQCILDKMQCSRRTRVM